MTKKPDGAPTNPDVLNVPVADLKENPRNPRTIDTHRFAALKRHLAADPAMLWARPLIALPDGTVIAGNMRLRAARDLGWTHVPAVLVELDSERATQWMIRDNESYGAWDDQLLAELLVELREADGNLDMTGLDNDDLQRLLESVGALGDTPIPAPSLVDRFGVPPLSVLDAKQGYWHERKDAWDATGLRGAVGRDDAVVLTRSGADSDYYAHKADAERVAGKTLTNQEYEADYYHPPSNELGAGGVSAFDPVLCEIAVRWFSPPGGTILDPFAGGPTRGVVAGTLDRYYTGIDLSAAQVAANHAMLSVVSGIIQRPVWIVGNSASVLADVPGPFDMLLSCPPYYDLETYSDDAADLSNAASYEAFASSHAAIIRMCVDRLADDSFAVWVVGEARDTRTGALYGIVPDTIRAFTHAGLAHENHAILCTPYGSAAGFSARRLQTSRRLTRVHQHVLTFVKGDAKRAAERCGDATITDA